MYYYILEPLKGQLNSRNVEKIKDVLGDLGIAGETVTPSSARSIEELAHLGAVKGYSTIVAVGSEALVNKVITVLASESLAKDTVLGVIPSDFTSALASRIGVSDLRSACNALKFRKLETMNLGLIEPNKYFLTEAVIESSRNKEIFFSMDKIQGKASAKKIVIKPGLEVILIDQYLEGTTVLKFTRWLFGKKEKDIYTSSFETHRIRFESERENLPIKVSGETIAKTPATFSNRARLLKIIVARDRLKEKKNPRIRGTGGSKKSKS